MILGQVLSKVAIAIGRWLAITALLAGLVSPELVQAAPGTQEGGPVPAQPVDPSGSYQLYLPITSVGGANDGRPVFQRDDLLAAESNLTVLSVSSGYAHACALRPDGRILCWGLDGFGQASPPPGEFIQVSAGANHTCAMLPDNTLTCWGEDTYGQASPPAGTFTDVSAGGYHTCALRPDGSLACWGWNAFGQLNNIPAGVFRAVSAGSLHTCALRDDGAVICWGSNSAGQSEAPAGRFTDISAGGTHSCAVADNGALTCWGSNNAGQSNAPAGTFRQVSAGDLHTCALRADGTVACWGHNGYGQLNDIPAGAFREISAGGQHTCAVRANGGSMGTLACWGWNRYGQSLPPSGVIASAGFAHACAARVDGSLVCWGENDSGQTDTPAGYFTRVSAGDRHSCAVDIDGALACWGSNSAGQAEPPGGVFLNVSAGGEHSCALRADGTLACWGSNSAGQSDAPAGAFSQVSAGSRHTCAIASGNGILCWGSDSAGQSTPPAGTFAQVTAGGEHTCSLGTDGVLTCWGSDSAGQSTPPGGTFSQISAGLAHTCGLRADGTVACWGDNTFGQSAAPAGLYTQVSAGGQHSCAVDLDGSVVCWGNVPPAPVLEILPASLPNARVGQPYSQALSVTGGEPPYTFQVVAGSLPAGLELSADGLLAGTPEAAGSFDFTVQAVDSSLPTADGQRAYTLVVEALADTTPPVIEAQVSGEKGRAGWYVGPVTVSWSVADPESPVTSQSGCDTVTLDEDTAGVTLTCSATSAGGASSASVTVKIDQTPPVNVAAHPEREPDRNGWYNHPVKITFSGEDALSGIDSCTQVEYSGPYSTGAAVSGTCTDVAGNTSQPEAFTFQYDAAAPKLELEVEPDPVYLNGKVTLKPEAEDGVSGIWKIRCDEPDTSTVGQKKVSCTVWDNAGNRTGAKAYYNVIYRFSGFLPPVENPPHYNRVVAGQTVPIKFILQDVKRRPVEGVEFDVRFEVQDCPANPKLFDLAETFELDHGDKPAGEKYHYNWKTDPALSGACVRLTVDLGEGPEVEPHFALFFFRK